MSSILCYTSLLIYFYLLSSAWPQLLSPCRGPLQKEQYPSAPMSEDEFDFSDQEVLLLNAVETCQCDLNLKSKLINYTIRIENKMSSIVSNEKPRRILNYYQIIKKLGEGAFGQIFLAKNIKDGSQVALKVESASVKRSQLLLQSKFIIDLAKSKEIGEEINIPNVFNIGKEGNCYVMVMDLLGNSLEDLLNICDRKFSLKTTIMIGLEMLKLIKFVHLRGVLHRDIKPDNFLIGRRQNIDRIYMIDFGLAKKFISKDKQHISYRDNKDLTGTARYASINTHLGIQQGRRDDLESMIYVLIYFLRGSLPWQSMKGQGKKQKYDKIMEKKLTIQLDQLCFGFPYEFQQMIAYVRGLHFHSEPNYDFLQIKMKQICSRQGYDLNVKDYDWIQVVQKKIAQKRRSMQNNLHNIK